MEGPRKPPAAGKGRPKGSVNKSTAILKEAALGAFEDVGGRAYLAKIAESNPKAFLAFVGKLIPQEVKAEVTNVPHEDSLDELE